MGQVLGRSSELCSYYPDWKHFSLLAGNPVSRLAHDIPLRHPYPCPLQPQLSKLPKGKVHRLPPQVRTTTQAHGKQHKPSPELQATQAQGQLTLFRTNQ